MKTQKKSGKNFIPYFICTGMMILFSVIENPIHAQAGLSSFNLASIFGEVTNKDSVFSEISPNTGEKDMVKGSDKRILGNGLRMVFSLFRQPFLSRKSQNSGPYDVIIVPGFPYNKDKGAGLILKARIKWAHYLISEGIAKNVIFSGSSVYTPYIESRIMALYAMELGIPADHIYCETRAEHSTENVVYSYRLAEKLGFKRIAIATGPYQSAFLSAYVKDHSLPVSFIPITITFMAKADPARFSDIDPSTAFVGEFVSLKDRESRSERFQGTLGNKIEE